MRGLDYYRHTAFEFITDRLGAQGTVLGGGRYDGLIENLGGPSTPAVGWAAGIERLAMLLEDFAVPTLDVVIALEDDARLPHARRTLQALRHQGLASELVASGSPRKRYDKAAKIPAKALVSIGTRDDALAINARSSDDALAARVTAIATDAA